MFAMPMRLSFPTLLAICIALCTLLPFSRNCRAASPPKIPAHNSTSTAQLLRSDPGYLQYLESKSLLGSSRELARIVSGSQIMWHAPASDPTPERLLQVASSWLSVHPVPLLTRGQEPVFGHLASPVFWSIMRQTGLDGLYISPASGTGALWSSALHRVTDWEGMVQLAFTDLVGDDRDYGLLLGRANKERVFLGLEMTQAATGLGPDFFLGARGNPEFRRLYRMREIPPQLWTELPKSTEEWDCQALSAEQIQKLVEANALPAGEDPHAGPCDAPWGWAVTGTVLTGVKGEAKRLAYRYHLNPLRPILDWEDPQAGARRILSACAIRRIGTQGAALLGMQTLALHGLNPGAKPGDPNPEPALSAAVSIGREVRRYGAWTWLEDELSLPRTRGFVSQGPDFARDTVSSPGAEHALLTGNAELVRFMYDEAHRLGLDQRKLVRRLPDERGLSYALPHLCSLEDPGPFSPARIREQAMQRGGAWAGSTLYAGSAGLAALALKEDSSSAAARAAIRQGQSLLLFFRAMQPGLFMLPARDLVGALPLDGKQGRRPPPGNEPMLAMHGAYNLLSTADDAPAGKGGLPRATQLYPPLDVQQMQPAGNFLKSVKDILRIRKQTGIAAGRFVTRLPTKNPGSIALLFALQGDQGAVLTVCNFSRASSHESFNLNLPEAQPFARGGVRHLWGASGDGSSVSLGPWQGAAFLLGKMPEANASGASSRAPVQSVAQGKTEASADRAAAPKSLHAPGAQRLARGEKTHVIQPGDQLNAIAARYKLSPQIIMDRNNMPFPDLLVEGRTLIIPAPDATPVQAVPSAAAQKAEAPTATPLPSAPKAPLPAASPPPQTPPAPLLSPPPPDPHGLPEASPPRRARQETLQDGEQRYLVQTGDTLGRVAARHNVRTEAIMQRNKLSSADLLVEGRTLIIPAPGGEQRYLVQRGDTLSRIAAQHKVRPEAIMQRNSLPSANHIVEGRTLIIPAPGQ